MHHIILFRYILLGSLINKLSRYLSKFKEQKKQNPIWYDAINPGTAVTVAIETDQKKN